MISISASNVCTYTCNNYDEIIVFGQQTYNFTTDNIIQGSYNSFVAGDFNSTPSVFTKVDTTLNWPYADLMDRKVYTQHGILNLLICEPSDEWSIAKFYDNMGYSRIWPHGQVR